MPKRTDIKKIMLIGSGPIVIGQACEFDYSGVQACKALREEGYEVVLVNSNPATIMTDPEFADRTYIEPLTRRDADRDHPPRAARRAAAHAGRPDGAEPGHGTARRAACWSATGVEMIGAKRRGDPQGRGPRPVQGGHAGIGLDLPRSGLGPHPGGGAAASATRSAASRWSSGPASRWAARAAASPATSEEFETIVRARPVLQPHLARC